MPTRMGRTILAYFSTNSQARLLIRGLRGAEDGPDEKADQGEDDGLPPAQVPLAETLQGPAGQQGDRDDPAVIARRD